MRSATAKSIAVGELEDSTGTKLKDTNLYTHYLQLLDTNTDLITTLSARPPSTWRADYFSNAAFDDARIKEQHTYELYLQKTAPPSNAVACPNCGRTTVEITKTQKARADEGGSAIGTCKSCGNKFPIH